MNANALSLDCSDEELLAKVSADIVTGWRAKLALSHARQRRIKQESDRLAAAAIEGVGTPTMRVEANAFHFWGLRLGYDCWKDDNFCREFARDNPEVRVNVEKRTNRIVVPDRWEGGNS
jgi:hypothetical protein